MSIVLDTSIVVALAVADEPDHGAVRDWIAAETEELVTTPLVLAEIDHVLERRAGREATEAVLDDFRRGAYRVHWWEKALVESITALRSEWRLEIGLTDASLIALAEHLGTTRIGTLDQRHFRQVRPRDPFALLPADA